MIVNSVYGVYCLCLTNLKIEALVFWFIEINCYISITHLVSSCLVLRRCKTVDGRYNIMISYIKLGNQKVLNKSYVQFCEDICNLEGAVIERLCSGLPFEPNIADALELWSIFIHAMVVRVRTEVLSWI